MIKLGIWLTSNCYCSLLKYSRDIRFVPNDSSSNVVQHFRKKLKSIEEKWLWITSYHSGSTSEANSVFCIDVLQRANLKINLHFTTFSPSLKSMQHIPKQMTKKEAARHRLRNKHVYTIKQYTIQSFSTDNIVKLWVNSKETEPGCRRRYRKSLVKLDKK